MQSLIMDSKVCLHSNRIYMDELLKKENIDLSTFVETFGSYNVAKINAYNFLFDETFFTGMEQEKRSGNKEYEMSVVQVLLH